MLENKKIADRVKTAKMLMGIGVTDAAIAKRLGLCKSAYAKFKKSHMPEFLYLQKKRR
jgi:hypothetical protein